MFITLTNLLIATFLVLTLIICITYYSLKIKELKNNINSGVQNSNKYIRKNNELDTEIVLLTDDARYNIALLKIINLCIDEIKDYIDSQKDAFISKEKMQSLINNRMQETISFIEKEKFRYVTLDLNKKSED